MSNRKRYVHISFFDNHVSIILLAKNRSMIYIIINNLFAGVSSGTSNGVRQALLSLPSSPRKEIQGLQVKSDLPDGLRPTGSLDIQHLKQNIHDIHQTEETSVSKMSQNGNVKQTRNQVPSSASSSTHSSSTSFIVKTHEILTHCGHGSQGSTTTPLISSDVAIQLLKIQSSEYEL